MRTKYLVANNDHHTNMNICLLFQLEQCNDNKLMIVFTPCSDTSQRRQKYFIIRRSENIWSKIFELSVSGGSLVDESWLIWVSVQDYLSGGVKTITDH